jgi:hypothetical protein
MTCRALSISPSALESLGTHDELETSRPVRSPDSIIMGETSTHRTLAGLLNSLETIVALTTRENLEPRNALGTLAGMFRLCSPRHQMHFEPAFLESNNNLPI